MFQTTDETTFNTTVANVYALSRRLPMRIEAQYANDAIEVKQFDPHLEAGAEFPYVGVVWH